MIGTILFDKYKVISLLGSGGMGQIYACQRLNIGDEVAIKVLTGQVDKRELLNEARAACMSNHPNICKVFDYFEENNQGFLVMEKLNGMDLQSMIRYKLQNSERFSFRFIFGVIRETAMALRHAHQSVLHRDIKPANIFLTTLGEIKILDFGIAQLVKDKSKNTSHSCTEAYSSPELWVNDKYDTTHYDASNDLYSLGLIFYELFHLKAAFRRRPDQRLLALSSESHKAPIGFEELFRKWVHPKKTERFKNAQELITEINSIYPDDFDIKLEVQQEIEKIKHDVERTKTLQNISVPLHHGSTIKRDNMWPLVASFALVIFGFLAIDYFVNTGRTAKLHEETVQAVKKNKLQRGLASPKKEDQFSI
jgi:serine/threonine protein kinase